MTYTLSIISRPKNPEAGCQRDNHQDIWDEILRAAPNVGIDKTR
jgi:hypothetical protein